MAVTPLSNRSPFGTVVGRRPTTLSARAAERLAAGPLDALTLMRDVCQVDRLQPDAAERMALALLTSHEEFVQLPSGHWALRDQPEPLSTSSSGPSATVLSDAPNGLSDVSFAVVDVETTGTRSSGGDRVTEIAIARVHGGQIVEVYSQLVNPERLIPAHITALTQITWDMVKDQPPFRQVAEQVTSRLAGHVFTAHNASFDWRFVSDELARGGMRLAGPRLCTVRLARLLLPQLARRSLDHVTRYFGIDVGARHRAGGDAEATARVLLRLIRIAEEEGLSSWPLLEARLASPMRRRGRTASDRRRRAFPLPAIEDHIA
ncbi:MAG: 3'-5' exonuclease [Gemmatimonadaceae bacterium]|nr:3'-5' exonuclease [Gemmatimonadaceae bacterium]